MGKTKPADKLSEIKKLCTEIYEMVENRTREQMLKEKPKAKLPPPPPKDIRWILVIIRIIEKALGPFVMLGNEISPMIEDLCIPGDLQDKFLKICKKAHARALKLKGVE